MSLKSLYRWDGYIDYKKSCQLLEKFGTGFELRSFVVTVKPDRCLVTILVRCERHLAEELDMVQVEFDTSTKDPVDEVHRGEH